MTEINNVNNLQNKNLEFKSPDSVKPQEQEENSSIFFMAEIAKAIGNKIAESIKEDGTFPTAYELKETINLDLDKTLAEKIKDTKNKTKVTLSEMFKTDLNNPTSSIAKIVKETIENKKEEK